MKKVRKSGSGENHVEQHFLPASYLQHWCNDDGRLFHFSRQAGRFLVGRASPKSICKEPHLYTMHGLPEDKAKAIETHFLTPLIDEPGAIVQKKLLAGVRTLTAEEMHQWARYLMALKARTPEVIAVSRSQATANVRQALKDAQPEYDQIRKEGDPATLEAWLDPSVLENSHLRVFPKIVDHEKTRTAFVGLKWRCFEFSAGPHDLLTCDRAVTWIGGPALPTWLIALPLSPTVAFVATNHLDALQRLDAMTLRDRAKRFNESAISNAKEYVYASREKAHAFIEQRLNVRMATA